MDRRNMLSGLVGGLMGYLGFGERPKVLEKGIIIFNVNVGSLSTYRAEAYLERIKERLKWIDGWEYCFIPIRGDSNIQVFLLKDGKKEEVESLITDFSFKNTQNYGRSKN